MADQDSDLQSAVLSAEDRARLEAEAAGVDVTEFEQQYAGEEEVPAGADISQLPTVDTAALEQQIQLEKQYGNRPIEAALQSAASAATGGASDVALRAAGYTAEELREIRERAPYYASELGTVGGIVGPALATGGTSLGARALATPALASAAAGKAAQQIAAKAMPGTAAKIIAGLTAREAAQGAIAGTGQLVSDVALERRELSPESILATTGVGALVGGAFGGSLGIASTAAPPILKKTSNAIAKVVNPAKAVAKEYADDILDRTEGYLNVFAPTGKSKDVLRAKLGTGVADLGDYAETHLKFGVLKTPKQLAAQNKQVLSSVGSALEDVINDLDTQVAPAGFKANVGERLKKVAAQELDELSKAFGAKSKQAMVVRRYIKSIDNYLEAETPFSFKELNEWRKSLGGVAFPGGTALEAFEGRFAGKLMAEQRNILDDLVEKFAPKQYNQFKELNRLYHIGKSVEKPLQMAARQNYKISVPTVAAGVAAATTGYVSPELIGGVVLGAGPIGRATRNAMLLYDIKGKTDWALKMIQDGVQKAITKAPKGATFTLPATTALVRSQLALNQQGKAPKTKQEAFANTKANIEGIVSNPELMVDVLAKKTSKVSQADPIIGQGLQERLLTAVQFLNSKIPKRASTEGMFSKPYQPSSLELAKFERYVQIADQPFTVFQELSQGTLTREHVEALQALYPDIYKEIRAELINNLPQYRDTLSYERRLQLGILMNVPADSSLQPQALLQLQQSINAQQQPLSPGPQFSPSAMGQTGMSDRLATQTEKVAKKQAKATIGQKQAKIY